MLSTVIGLSILVLTTALDNPVDYVNILGGTNSHYDLSRGGTLPLLGRPWGFNTWAPFTDKDNDGWWFHPSDRRYYGMRCTHQPSPWINDYGNFVVKASIPVANHANDPNDYSGYSPKDSTYSPYYFKTSLMAYGTLTDTMDIDFTATRHGAIMKAKFPKATDSDFLQTRRISVTLNGGSDTSLVSTSLLDTITISGSSSANHGGVAGNFAHYFVVAIYSGENGDESVTSMSNQYYDSNWAYVEFSPEDTPNMYTLRIGTSFISLEQAILNMRSECGTDKMFDDVKSEGKVEWNTALSRVSVEDVGVGYTANETNDKLKTFYSSLYRASLFPRQITEVDSTGKTVHWSPYDGEIHEGALSADSGFWDAYITVYPLLTLINQPQLSVTLQGWLNAYKEGSWLPKWSSPGYRTGMVGTMGDVTLADAIVKGVPNFDVNLAYEAIRKDAFEVPPLNVGGIGRVCLEGYLKYGYIPIGASMTTGGTCSEIVSRSLNYMQADWAIAQAATVLNKSSDAAILYSRAGNFSKMFEPETGFFRSRYIITEKFTETFDQFSWGGDYTEAGPWQYKFYVPWLPMELKTLYADNKRDLCKELETAQEMQSTFHVGNYGSEIHEQTEMPDLCWGQYEHNNQPVHYMLYMFGAVDSKGYQGSCAAKGQYWLRRAMTQLYRPDADMFVGDEDNGEMSAWYIMSSMGLFSLAPGSTDYVFGSPLFGKMVINIGNDATDAKTLIIMAKQNSASNVYVQRITFNDELITANSISHAKLMSGGTLMFEMGPFPVKV